MIQSALTVQFDEWPCVVTFARYPNGRLAIVLLHADDGDPIAKATINVPDVQLADDEVIIKDYAENEGMFDALVSAGVVEDTGKRVVLPYGIEAPICRVLVEVPA